MAALALAVFSGGIAPALARAASERTLAALKAQAARLASQGKLDKALEQVAAARELVRRHGRMQAAPRRKPDPRMQRDLKALNAWMAERSRLARSGNGDMAATLRTYNSRRAALMKKHGAGAGPAAGASPADLAKNSLLLASLDDLAATYQERKGARDAATFLRGRAATTRVAAYRALHRLPEAARSAEKLLRTQSRNPAAYEAAGGLFQEQGQYGKAAGVWERGIRLLTSRSVNVPAAGRGPDHDRARNRLLQAFYRQVAFCYQKLGRTREAQMALQAALRREPSRSRRPR
jgi:tetratricopeptide (TPR) repeat protein